MTERNVTSTDVAKRAGVSQSTVSRVFGAGAKVSKDKHERIMKAAGELGYRPNAIARGLITQKTNMIGIVMRDIKNPFYPEVLQLFYKKLTRLGYHLIFINADNEEIDEDEIYQLIEYKVDGVIITDATPTMRATQHFMKQGIAVILFNRYVRSMNCSAVYCNNEQAGTNIAQMAVNKGFKNIAMISGPLDTSTAQDRLFGTQLVFEKNKDIHFRQVEGHYTYSGGYQAGIRLLEEGMPELIICGNDIMALGAMDALRKKDVSIPEQVSILGFDDISMASWPSYDLTTWKQPMEEMVEKTVELLNEEIKEKARTPRRVPIEGKLIERSTVRERA